LHDEIPLESLGVSSRGAAKKRSKTAPAEGASAAEHPGEERAPLSRRRSEGDRRRYTKRFTVNDRSWIVLHKLAGTVGADQASGGIAGPAQNWRTAPGPMRVRGQEMDAIVPEEGGSRRLRRRTELPGHGHGRNLNVNSTLDEPGDYTRTYLNLCVALR